MPPHARMSLAQMLLLRSMVARFWGEPYDQRLVRWGTELHDRFLLPHFVRADFQEVICDLQRAGYAFAMDWFAPFFEFRFPHYGDLVTENGIDMELRAAIEPSSESTVNTSSAITSENVCSSASVISARSLLLSTPKRTVRPTISCASRNAIPLRTR